MSNLKFAQAIINLVQSYARPVTGDPLARLRDHATAEQLLLKDAERLDSNKVINETNRPPSEPIPCPACRARGISGKECRDHWTAVNPPMIPVTLACGHSRFAAPHVLIGEMLRCNACPGVARVMQKFGASEPHWSRTYRPFVEPTPQDANTASMPYNYGRTYSEVTYVRTVELNDLRALHHLIKTNATLREVLNQVERIDMVSK